MPNQTSLKQAAHQKLIDDIFAGIEANVIGEDEPRPIAGPQRNGTAQAVRRARNQVKAYQRQALKLEKEKWL